MMKIKRHLLCWHLLQSHTPPPLLHPSCHNCKNSTNTHAHSYIFTLTHTHHFSCSHLFPLTMALSSWCLCAHSLPQLVCNVCVRVCVRACVCICVSHHLLLLWFQLSSDMKCQPLDSNVLCCPPLSCEKLRPPKTQSVLRLSATREFKWQ